MELSETHDHLRTLPPTTVREGDHVILSFNDGRQIFAHCTGAWNGKGKTAPLKINRRNYQTKNLIGLRYGTVLELGHRQLNPLPPSEELQPDSDLMIDDPIVSDDVKQTQEKDNRDIVDNNTAQNLDRDELNRMKEEGVDGSTIVKHIIQNSSTFDQKTDFSKAKYIARKQMKYQQRCRLIRSTPTSVCEAYFWRDPKKIMNLRDDSLGQILSYSNISAGCQTLVIETCLGVVTGAVAARMGGYGRILSVYPGQQPSFTGVIDRFNLSFGEQNSIKWIHSSDVFCEDGNDETIDEERIARDKVEWPCPLQDHTRAYLEGMESEKEKKAFFAKRAERFTRKLTRHTPLEARAWYKERKSDSIIIVARFDPTETLFSVFHSLAPSCPFVVFCEYLEPLTACFQKLQENLMAINLRLSNTWAREFQILPGRTHPNMNMNQNGKPNSHKE